MNDVSRAPYTEKSTALSVEIQPLCPKCKTCISENTEYCPGCGYAQPANGSPDVSVMNQEERLKEISRISAGPFSFAFPVVENAYQFQPGGKVTPGAIKSMLFPGLGVAVFGGILLYPVHALIASFLTWVASQSDFRALLALISAFVLLPGAALVLGILISSAVGKGAVKGDCKNQGIIGRIGLIAGLVGFGTYLAVYIRVMGMVEGFDSVIDFLKLGIYLFLIVGMPWGGSSMIPETTPFCEQCQHFMKETQIGKWPIRHERALMEVIFSRQFEGVSNLDKKGDTSNHTMLIVHYCDRCREKGFLNAKTSQVRFEVDNKGFRNPKSETRLIFSTSLERPEIEELLFISNPFLGMNLTTSNSEESQDSETLTY